MLNVLHRRFPNIEILLTPVKVQGEGAASSIANAVKWLNSSCGEGSRRRVDVIIVGRGGGSLEDLWAFNEEVVARAISDSVIPVISAVGHEVDFALSDFVADLRAPTPSAAAELVVQPKSDFEAMLQQHSDDMRRAMIQRRDLLSQQLKRLAASAVLTRPEQALSRYAQRVDHLEMRLMHAVQQSAVQSRRRAEQIAGRLQIVRAQRISDLRVRIERCGELVSALLPAECLRIRTGIQALERQLNLLNPLKVLDRGYSLTRTERGSLLRSVKQIGPESGIVTLLKDGYIGSIVSSVKLEDEK
jgi:exodeoxyribonuclease VII large subunit